MRQMRELYRVDLPVWPRDALQGLRDAFRNSRYDVCLALQKEDGRIVRGMDVPQENLQRMQCCGRGLRIQRPIRVQRMFQAQGKILQSSLFEPGRRMQ
jgi:hypothetical protein